jgi:redox-sensitive bicupin YhaK (pirin superfamily)
MSEFPDVPPEETASIACVLSGKPRDLGGFTVRRVLPARRRSRVGPFVFFDHMGPFVAGPGTAIAVRPHPHIGLATVTYLFDGELVHRDSLGSEQVIVPGDVNWMTAGRGIVHSERMRDEALRKGVTMHGLQCWVGLPTVDEECEPSFAHTASEAIPSTEDGVRVVIGSAYGRTSPVRTRSATLFVDAALAEGRTLEPPPASDAEELAAYVVTGRVACDGIDWGAGEMLVFRGDERPALRATLASRVVLVGGGALDGDRHVYWNFVSSSRERIEAAKRDWRAKRFPKVPGDEVEFIPLPPE